MSRLQKDENGRVFFFDGSMVAGSAFWKFCQGKGPDPRICYLDSINVMAKDDEPCDLVDEQYGIRWKKRYSAEDIDRMWEEAVAKQEAEDYGVTTG
jgi:hypothetical protein